MQPQGTLGAQSTPLPPPPRPGHPWVSPQPPCLLQAALSVPGYVETDKENGESVWVAPSAPGPGDALSPRSPLGQSGERPRNLMAPPVPNLLPRVAGAEKLPRPCSLGASRLWRGRAWLGTDSPSPEESNLGLEGVGEGAAPRAGRRGGRLE